jgi:hypothetical protein
LAPSFTVVVMAVCSQILGGPTGLGNSVNLERDYLQHLNGLPHPVQPIDVQ